MSTPEVPWRVSNDNLYKWCTAQVQAAINDYAGWERTRAEEWVQDLIWDAAKCDPLLTSFSPEARIERINATIAALTRIKDNNTIPTLQFYGDQEQETGLIVRSMRLYVDMAINALQREIYNPSSFRHGSETNVQAEPPFKKPRLRLG